MGRRTSETMAEAQRHILCVEDDEDDLFVAGVLERIHRRDGSLRIETVPSTQLA